jgi:hypothetical protein
MTPEAHRAYALEVASQGFALLAHAVNACDNPATPYRFADAERERFMSLCARLYTLVERGRIESRASALAQDDVDFQRFVSRSLAAPPDDLPGDGVAIAHRQTTNPREPGATSV